MQILASNDDGIRSPWLWALVGELKKIARIIVAAPDRERSAIGTAVTLRQTLRVKEIESPLPEVTAYSVDGTPSDSVILALGKLAQGKVDLVVAGINQGLNLGEDVHISGTVGAALQAYLRGFPAIAVSSEFRNGETPEAAARVAALLAKRILALPPTPNILLNVNLPSLPLEQIRDACLTRLASSSHINTVEEGNDNKGKYYCLVRQTTDNIVDETTDVWAVEQGTISITPLYTTFHRRPSIRIMNQMCSGLLQELRQG